MSSHTEIYAKIRERLNKLWSMNNGWDGDDAKAPWDTILDFIEDVMHRLRDIDAAFEINPAPDGEVDVNVSKKLYATFKLYGVVLSDCKSNRTEYLDYATNSPGVVADRMRAILALYEDEK